MSILSAPLARIKSAVIVAVDRNGGVDGAAATAERARSTAGRWRNRNKPDFPTVDAAHKLDEVIVLQGGLPPILRAQARELGFTLQADPDGDPDVNDYFAAMAEVSRGAGDFTARLAEAVADKKIQKMERTELRKRIAALIDDLVATDGLLERED